ncbi:MAG: helix-turn-helix domain-containing protein, partial [Halorhabdus sp.]
MTDAEPTEIEQTVLDRLAEEETSTPATIALGVDVDLGTVYDVIRSLRERGLLERVGFDTCRLTDR